MEGALERYTKTHTSKALAAVDRPIGLGLKGNPSLAAAGSAGGSEVLTGATGGILAGVTAGLAALGLVLEAALGVELLLTGSEHELLATFLAYECLVFKHDNTLSLTLCPGQDKPTLLGHVIFAFSLR